VYWQNQSEFNWRWQSVVVTGGVSTRTKSTVTDTVGITDGLTTLAAWLLAITSLLFSSITDARDIGAAWTGLAWVGFAHSMWANNTLPQHTHSTHVTQAAGSVFSRTVPSSRRPSLEMAYAEESAGMRCRTIGLLSNIFLGLFNDLNDSLRWCDKATIVLCMPAPYPYLSTFVASRTQPCSRQNQRRKS